MKFKMKAEIQESTVKPFGRKLSTNIQGVLIPVEEGIPSHVSLEQKIHRACLYQKLSKPC